MAEVEAEEKGLEDLKEEDMAEPNNLLQEEEEVRGMEVGKLVVEEGGGEQVSVETQQSDEIQPQLQDAEQEEDDDDEMEGPPPGWGSTLPLPLPPSPPAEEEQELEGGRRERDLQENQQLVKEEEEEEGGHKLKEEEEGERGHKLKEEEEQLEDDDEIEGPPPGWESSVHLPHPPSPNNQACPPFCPPTSRDKVEEDEDDQMEGPPPGWASPPWQPRPSSTPPHGQSLSPLPPSKRAHVFCKSCHRHISYPQGSMHVRCSTCQIVHPAVEEKVQMVCGFCRRLLSYPLGSRFIQCSLCKQVNYVLQEHEVGQVKCENCAELLMYPNGAPSVRCTKCHFVTDVGEHNRRPPVSVQQGRAPPPGTVAH